MQQLADVVCDLPMIVSTDVKCLCCAATTISGKKIRGKVVGFMAALNLGFSKHLKWRNEEGVEYPAVLGADAGGRAAGGRHSADHRCFTRPRRDGAGAARGGR